MSTTHQSSGSEGDPQIPFDDRKRKRMLSNRESAKRSRMKKLQHLDDLNRQGSDLREENGQIAMRTDLMAEKCLKIESENAILRAQMLELTERLKSMNSVLRFVEEFSGSTLDIPEIPEPDRNPWKLPAPMYPILATSYGIDSRQWQLPCSAQPIMAASDMFFC